MKRDIGGKLSVFCVLAVLSVASAVSFGQTVQDCVAPPSGLVNWWPADGDAKDIVGGNHGTLMNSATFAPGVVGLAFDFDGVDDFIVVADEEQVDFGSGPFSISVWVRTLGGRSFNEHILSKGYFWDGHDDYVLWVSPAKEASDA